jgi:hypothetical protein
MPSRIIPFTSELFVERVFSALVLAAAAVLVGAFDVFSPAALAASTI